MAAPLTDGRQKPVRGTGFKVRLKTALRLFTLLELLPAQELA
jgi:hypothetical protein